VVAAGWENETLTKNKKQKTFLGRGGKRFAKRTNEKDEVLGAKNMQKSFLLFVVVAYEFDRFALRRS